MLLLYAVLFRRTVVNNDLCNVVVPINKQSFILWSLFYVEFLFISCGVRHHASLFRLLNVCI